MDADRITITLSKEEYEEMKYCIDYVRKQRLKSINYYHKKKNGNVNDKIDKSNINDKNDNHKRRYGRNIQIPQINSFDTH